MTENGKKLAVPHMGWNQIAFEAPSPLFKGIKEASDVYFVHSFYVKPDDRSVVSTVTNYGIDFCSSITRGNLVATQFHPEKSQETGLHMLRNFGEML
jgi:glutamine amidotransferase